MQIAQFTEPLTLLDRQRFTRVWKHLSRDFQAQHCDDVFGELTDHYSMSDRFYHTDVHIQHCLQQLDEAVGQKSGKPPLQPHLEMAIWFHDVIYSPGDPKNEKNSADWFRSHAYRHFAEEDIKKIVNLITITEHRDKPESEGEKLMVDIDLSSFGLPERQFEEDGERIRQEFRAMSEQDFFKGQIAFLQSLLARPAVYSTAYFHDNFESIARKNITGLLMQYRSALMH